MRLAMFNSSDSSWMRRCADASCACAESRAGDACCRATHTHTHIQAQVSVGRGRGTWGMGHATYRQPSGSARGVLEDFENERQVRDAAGCSSIRTRVVAVVAVVAGLRPGASAGGLQVHHARHKALSQEFCALHSATTAQ